MPEYLPVVGSRTRRLIACGSIQFAGSAKCRR